MAMLNYQRVLYTVNNLNCTPQVQVSLPSLPFVEKTTVNIIIWTMKNTP